MQREPLGAKNHQLAQGETGEAAQLLRGGKRRDFLGAKNRREPPPVLGHLRLRPGFHGPGRMVHGRRCPCAASRNDRSPRRGVGSRPIATAFAFATWHPVTQSPPEAVHIIHNNLVCIASTPRREQRAEMHPMKRDSAPRRPGAGGTAPRLALRASTSCAAAARVAACSPAGAKPGAGSAGAASTAAPAGARSFLRITSPPPRTCSRCAMPADRRFAAAGRAAAPQCAYAGCALRNDAGEVLGTLAVYDTAPPHFAERAAARSPRLRGNAPRRRSFMRGWPSSSC